METREKRCFSLAKSEIIVTFAPVITVCNSDIVCKNNIQEK